MLTFDVLMGNISHILQNLNCKAWLEYGLQEHYKLKHGIQKIPVLQGNELDSPRGSFQLDKSNT